MFAEFVALGGTLDPKRNLPPIGCSAYLLKVGSSGLLVDFGVHPEIPLAKEGEPKTTFEYQEIGGQKFSIFPDLQTIFERDETFFLRGYGSRYLPRHEVLKTVKHLYVVATHGHIDHVGALPYLKRKYPEARVMMTEPTLEISSWIWNDNLRLTRSQRGRLLFDALDIENLRRSVTVIHQRDRLRAGPFEIQFFPAGHILGALGLMVTVKEGGPCKIFFSGDLSFRNQHTVPGASLKEIRALGPCDYVVTESTYAGRKGRAREAVEEELLHDLGSILRRGGKTLFGARSVGHAQEIFALLESAGVTSRWPTYIDGSAQEIGRIYSRYLPLSPDITRHFVQGDVERGEIIEAEKPLIMISPSGMFSGGRAVEYTLAWGKDSRNLIAITSYQRPSSPGSQLLSAKRGSVMVLRGVEITLNALVKGYQLASHLDGDELLELIGELRPERAFLVHGEETRMEKVIAILGPWVTKTFVGETYSL